MTYGEKINVNVSLSSSINNVHYNSSFSIGLSNKLTKQQSYSIIYNDGQENNIAEFIFTSDENGEWTLGDKNQLIINYNNTPYTFNISIIDNELVFKFINIDVSSSDLEILKTQLKNYILSNFVARIKNDQETKDVSLSSCIGIKDLNDDATEITSDEHKFTINLGPFDQDTLILDGQNVILGYDKDKDLLQYKNSTITIKGYKFNIQISNNQIILINTNSGVEEIQEDILGYFANLTYITNNFDDSLDVKYLNSNYNKEIDILNKDKQKIGSVVINYSLINFDWNTNKNTTISVVGNKGSAHVTFSGNYSELTKYTLNDIIIYWGQISFELSVSADFEIENAYIKKEFTGNAAYKISIKDSDKSEIVEIEDAFISDYQKPINQTITGDADINVIYYSTYTMDKDDSGYVNIILKTPNNNILYVENNINSDSGTLNLEPLNVGELVRGYEEKLINDDKLVVLLKLMISSGENQNGELSR